jgi:hypothetical protein
VQNGFCPVDQFLRGVPTLEENVKCQEACFGKYPTGGQVGDGVLNSELLGSAEGVGWQAELFLKDGSLCLLTFLAFL